MRIRPGDNPSPVSNEEYKDGLAYVEVELPDHGLLPKLREGASAVNKLYLKRLIKDAREKEAERAEDKPLETDEPKLMELNARRRKLYAKRSKLSNAFHKMRTNKQRSLNSQQIQIVQRDIVAIEAQINHWKLTGERPRGPFEDLPEDRWELFKIKENARKHIPRMEKGLEKLYNLPAHTPGRLEKIKKKETKLSELKRIKAYVEKTLKKANV